MFPPILSLPPEITQRIFQASLPSTGAPNSTAQQPLSQQAPLLLTQICSDWRDIALDTPELWQSIVVDRSTGYVNPAMVRLWMSRAKNHPRDISFATQDPKRGTEFLVESMEHSQQWRDVELCLPLESFSDLAAHHGPFPFLRSLSLSLGSETYNFSLQTITIRGAPLLREMTLTDLPFLAADIAWEQLTTLKMTALESETLLAIPVVRRCSNLVKLEVTIQGRHTSPDPPFTLPSLTALLTAGDSIIPFITVPSLEQLDIRGPRFLSDMEPLTDSLRALLERSACPLTCLSFRVPPMITTSALRAFLLVAAAVVKLDLTLLELCSRDGLSLIAVLQTVDVLPQLTALHITDVTADTFDPLLDTLRARRVPVAGRALLQSFSLFLPKPRRWEPARLLPDTIISELTALADDGLRIHIVGDTVLMDR
ncbi:hypothetical protein DFH09DRAFT_1358996 [Mycena vulgaris]|nr:hypothetical protein DFH09DRAFT_1358996 [Mycena vulgaris]